MLCFAFLATALLPPPPEWWCGCRCLPSEKDGWRSRRRVRRGLRGTFAKRWTQHGHARRTPRALPVDTYRHRKAVSFLGEGIYAMMVGCEVAPPLPSCRAGDDVYTVVHYFTGESSGYILWNVNSIVTYVVFIIIPTCNIGLAGWWVGQP
jgi:hypothetical protein